MDQKLNEFNLIIDQKKETHKNICLLWKNWIKIKKQHFENELKIATEKIKHIEDHIDSDIPIETLVILTTLKNNNLI